MKELLKQAFIQGIEKNETYFPVLDNVIFNKWFESNKHLLDNAIDSYLESQGKVIVKGTKITRDLGRYELQDDPQEIDYGFGDYKPGRIVMEKDNSD